MPSHNASQESSHRRPLKIGIVGAGLVGAATAIALSKLPDANVTIFERAPGPHEVGAWISLPVSGLMVLDRLLNLEEIQKILYRGDNNGTYITRHWRIGELIATAPTSGHIAPRFIQGRTHRVPLLSVSDDGVRLHFADAASESFDILVATDGIYSKIRRKYIPAQVTFKGVVAYRKIFPQNLVAHIQGLPNDTSSWRKDGEVIFLSRLGMDVYGVVAIIGETREFAGTLRWARSIGSEGLQRLRSHFSSWDATIGQTINDIDAYPLDSEPWMKQLTQEDRIAFLGDATHPTAGAYGAGATIGYGDCWALFRSLQESYELRGKNNQPVITPYDIPRALRLYNETRRHFLGRVEQQMSPDCLDAKYVAASNDDEDEWIRRSQEKHRNHLWLTEHDVEAEFVKTLASESYWSSKSETARVQPQL